MYDYYYDDDDYDRYNNDYVYPEDEEFYEYIYNDDMSVRDKQLFEQCLRLSDYDDEEDTEIFDFPLKEMATRFPYTYNQIVSHLLFRMQNGEHGNGQYLLRIHRRLLPIIQILVEHINTADVNVDADAGTSIIHVLFHTAFRFGNRSLFDRALDLIRNSDDHRMAFVKYQKRFMLFDMCNVIDYNCAHNIAIQKERIHMFLFLSDKLLSDTLRDVATYYSCVYYSCVDSICASDCYQDCCKNGLYLIAQFLIDLCGTRISKSIYNKMFVWACEHKDWELIDMYFRIDPYTYDALRITGDELPILGTGTGAYTPVDIYTRIGNSADYGIIRVPKNAKWQRDRLLLMGLHFNHKNTLPIDIVRTIHTFL